MEIKGKMTAMAVLVVAVSIVPVEGPAVTASAVDTLRPPAGRFMEAFRLTAPTCTKEQRRATPDACQPSLEAFPVVVSETTPDPTTPPVEPTVPPAEPALPSAEPTAPVLQARPAAPNYKPRGRATSYKLLGAGRGIAPHWDYCKPFTYMINPDRMTPSFQADIEQALDRFANASGIRFQYAGTTEYVPFDAYESLSNFGDGQLLVFAVSDKNTVRSLAGSVVAVGGSAYGINDNAEYLFYEGGITIDGDDGMALKPGFGPLGRGTMLLHELGHIAGLAHVNDDTQTMTPVMPRSYKGQYGAGDRAGFAHQANLGCAS